MSLASPPSAERAPDAPRLEDQLETLYAQRFDPKARAQKQVLWRTLYQSYFVRWVPRDGVVLDVGAGYCDFINQVAARERIAVDINPDTARYAAPGVTVHTIALELMHTLFPRRAWTSPSPATSSNISAARKRSWRCSRRCERCSSRAVGS